MWVIMLQAIRDNALPWYVALVAVLGLIAGSVMTVVISRLPAYIISNSDDTWFSWRPVSHCAQCLPPIHWYHNLPLFGWLWLQGRCHHCEQPVSKLYPLVEGATGVGFGLIAWISPQPYIVLKLAILFWFFLALAVIDARHLLLPDSLTLTLLWAGLIFMAVFDEYHLADAVIGAVAGYLFIWLLNLLWLRWRGYAGIGMGDGKLLAALGAWFGWQALPLLCLLAAGMGILWLVARYGMRRGSQQPLPFGVTLSLAGGMIACWQAWIYR